MLKDSSFGKLTSDFIGKCFGWLPINPNTVTLASVFLALLAYLSFVPITEGYLISLILFGLAFFFDALDGAIARAKKMTSKEGAFLDGITDRLVEFFLLLAILKIFNNNSDVQVVIFSILFFGTCMTSFVKAYAEHKGMLRHENAEKLSGILERAGRSILLVGVFCLFALKQQTYGVYGLYIIAGLSILTFGQRFWTVMLKPDGK